MKSMHYLFFTLAMLIGGWSIQPQEIMAQDVEDFVYIKIRVDGLSCPFCAYGLEKKLKKIKGAQDVAIELNLGLATLHVPADKKPTEEELRKIVKDAGFTPREIEFSDKPFNSDVNE